MHTLWFLASGETLTLCHFSQYQRCQPQGAQGAAAPASAPDLQWCVREAEQGLNQHAQNCRALHCMGVSFFVAYWVFVLVGVLVYFYLIMFGLVRSECEIADCCGSPVRLLNSNMCTESQCFDRIRSSVLIYSCRQGDTATPFVAAVYGNELTEYSKWCC